MRTETLAIVFTDIKGYTAATSAQTHQENALMLTRIERLIAPVVRGYSGRVIKSIGDAYMIVFRSPTEAVRCATAIQDRLHHHNTSASADQAIHIRIAMNLGEVRVHRGDVFGEPVNIAARIESVTPADEIYFAEAVYLTMNRTDLPSERVGEFELKGIPEPVTVYRVKKFAHAAGDVTDGGTVKAPGLPFGGTQLSHWQRMRWVRVAYFSIWGLALVGLLSAAYLRYRPTADYTSLLAEMKGAIEQNKPIEALAKAGQLPNDAVQEQELARRFRRQAVSMLLEAGDLDTASTEVNRLLNEDPRDAEALLLQGLVLTRRGNDPKGALTALAGALKMSPGLTSRPEVMNAVIYGYSDANARRIADGIVEAHLKHNAVTALTHALNDPAIDRSARNAIAMRLEKLGAGQDVDWVALAIEELKSTSCKTKKSAISRLTAESDERAVGPLMKVVEAKGCGAKEAQKTLDLLLGK